VFFILDCYGRVSPSGSSPEVLTHPPFIELDDGTSTEKTLRNISFTNGETIEFKNKNMTTDISTLILDGIKTDNSFLTGNIKIDINHPDINTNNKYSQYFTLTRTSGIPKSIFFDGFEDKDLSEYSESGSYGKVFVSEEPDPEGGSVSGVVQQSNGGGTDYTLRTNNTFNWNKSYKFKFLVKSNKYSGGAYLNTRIGWRGGTDDNIAIRMFRNGPNANSENFDIIGDGVINTNVKTGYKDWESNTWYYIYGEVDESNGKVRAKIWKVQNSEPESYQVEADITTGITQGDVYFYSNGYSTLDMRIAYAGFGK
jgi:hypothetical protein